MAEMKLLNKQQNGVDLSQEGVFDIRCLIKASDINYAAQSEFHQGQFLAFVSGASDLGLYYLKDSCQPVIKRVPWFQSVRKKIACLCFDPQGCWLLVASVDGSLFIVPARTLVDDYHPQDQKWTTQDITSFSSLNAQNNYARPSALAWWQGATLPCNVGILGTDQGEIIFVNLETGQKVGATKIEGRVASFFICQDTELDTVTLLITNQSREQWGLILEKPGSKYTYPLNNGSQPQRFQNEDKVDKEDTKGYPTARSRLQGLKQLSVEVSEKLVILKQKLAERNRNFESCGTRTDNSNRVHDSGAISSDNENCNETDFFSQLDSSRYSTTPVAVNTGTYISPQYLKSGRLIYSQVQSSANCLTIHENGMSSFSSHIYRIPEQSESILLTNGFFYISDTRHRFVHVVSRILSEVLKEDGSDYSKESVVARFSFNKSEEMVNSIFTLSSSRNTGDLNLTNHESKLYNLPKGVVDLKISLPPIDTCIIVTNLGIYKVIVREHIFLSLFMDLLIKRRAIKDATKLGKTFGLNVQQLIECAGDIVLCNREFSRAMELYSLAGCRLSKSILKFASMGHASEFLSHFISYSSSPSIAEMSVLNRIHFSNLSVLAFTQLTLRATSTHNKVIYKDYKDFFNFLSTNVFYDELFAMNIAAQSNMWCILNYLTACRGLGPQILGVITKASAMYTGNNSDFGPQTLHYLLCLSDSSLTQSLLNSSNMAKSHINIVLSNISTLRVYILKRLIMLYNPTHPVMRPLLLRFKARRRAASRSSFSSQGDSVEIEEDTDETASLVEEIIEAFLQVLLALLYRKQPSLKFCSKYVPFTPLSEIVGVRRGKTTSVDFKRRLLSTGFAHTALIRNGNVYTWGNTTQGCLGSGPTISRYKLAQEINMFCRQGVEVLSVSSGRCHTLAVTNNGVYAWGGNRYGQLGIVEPDQCPNPELVTELADEIIIDAIAGQYHSMALTSDGRLYTWGWGVHGQLGHGNTETCRQPRLVEGLLGLVIRHASAGYAHTLVLTADGYVYGFGFNLYGQLGLGHDVKQTSPVRISLLPERVTLIATKYFHSLAISCTNRLFIWGSNLQGVRQQWKARRAKQLRAKLSSACELIEKEAASTSEVNEEKENSTSDAKEVTNNNGPVAYISSNALEPPEADSPTADENQSHLWPKLVDTSLVHGKIVQISTGYNHSALLTKDGTIYVWGRNLDGQLGTGHKHDISIPTPLFGQPILLDFAQVDEGCESACQRDLNCSKKFLKICCGSNFMIAIETGGSVLAWGNNSLAQLGRTPKEQDERNLKDLVLKFRVSNRIINCIDHLDKLGIGAETTPNEVPYIPSPTISYQSYDVTPLAGSVMPLKNVEKELSDMTLHYVLEQFHGLYDSATILKKCSDIKNYQACAKIELLDRNLVEALIYQLRALKECNPDNLETFFNGMRDEYDVDNYKNDQAQDNSKLFEKHVEWNLMENLLESVKKQKIKMPCSKSLDSFQTIEQELHNFDCQGGSEEMFDDLKSDPNSESVEMALDQSLENGNKEDEDSSLSSDINEEMNDNESIPVENYDKPGKSILENALSSHELVVMQHAINIVDFYLNEVEEDAYVPMYEVSATAINFWVENKFPIETLEKIFDKYLDKIFYSLGLLLFGCDPQNTYTLQKSNGNIRVKNAEKILSTHFSLKICSMMLEHIDEGKPAPEYIQMLSVSMAKNYGPPLTGYPGTSENNTPQKMMDGIISTLSAKYNDPRPFIHLKDADKVSELLNAEEDSMIFTCGHQYSMSAYQSEAVPKMETELLTLQPPLPSTAQLLGTMLNQSHKPETVCPACLSQVLKDAAKSVNDF
ncbi:uncharacterized protein LOC106641130 [Copidosoma floridanum]|uniref:uncharacterized protein LOC106641130 n=1 Tax=Copidosoma floridanum TaxID=29053 RepID=UPI0006C98F77|nr:uncharacterized protein LOC106641130 [Copidosoma floridanum]XP_014210899.1 uncharacterized protein LOC106641130 [Copidosoma floridanum]XP_023248336.1 uncharacterized protein LOC106641130 [Copidosoma floridanum]